MDEYYEEESLKEEAIDLREYWLVLLKRKWTVIAFALPLFILVTIYSFVVKSTYTAKGTLLIEKEPNILTFEEVFKIETLMDDYYQTQFKILQSRSLADSVIERLKLYENKKFAGKLNAEKREETKSDPAVRSKLIERFLGKLNVKPVRQTRLVEVQFKDHEPKFAASVVNELFNAFIDMNIQFKYETTEQATEFLVKQIETLRGEIETKERQLQQYGAEKNIIALSETETTIIENLGALNKALTDAQIDRVRKQAYYSEIKNASPDHIPDAMTNPMIQRLREDYGRLSRDYMKKAETFKPDYPEMQRLKAELDSAESLLENETKNLINAAYSDYQAALKREKSLEAVFNGQKQDAIQLNSNAILYNSLKMEVDNRKSLLESLIKRESETGVAARLSGLRTSSVRVVDKAEAPLHPSSPKKKLNMLLALLMGLFGGVGLAFLFEHLDNSVKNHEDVEKSAGVPALGVVPAFSIDGFRRGYGHGRRFKLKIEAEEAKEKEREKEPQITSIELITHFSPKSNLSESYRTIRTGLLLSSTDQKPKAIIVSSALPEEGKSATLSNLAVTLAQAGKAVLIVDSDFRKPSQHRIFKIRNLDGLTNYLTRDTELKSLIKPTEIPNLFLVNSGPLPPNPAELLGSEKMAGFIEAIKGSFDYVLFDSPPVLTVSDAMVLGPKIDGVILVVWGGKTPREALRRAKEKIDLMKIKTLGVVINNIDVREHDYYYQYQYYHYYGDQK
jgi:capsular exopolysaccharide synthesis family protein